MYAYVGMVTRTQPFFAAVVRRHRSSNSRQIQNKRSKRTRVGVYSHRQPSVFLANFQTLVGNDIAILPEPKLPSPGRSQRFLTLSIDAPALPGRGKATMTRENRLDELSREPGEPAVTDRSPLGVTQPSGITEALRTTVASVSRPSSLYSI